MDLTFGKSTFTAGKTEDFRVKAGACRYKKVEVTFLRLSTVNGYTDIDNSETYFEDSAEAVLKEAGDDDHNTIYPGDTATTLAQAKAALPALYKVVTLPGSIICPTQGQPQYYSTSVTMPFRDDMTLGYTALVKVKAKGPHGYVVFRDIIEVAGIEDLSAKQAELEAELASGSIDADSGVTLLQIMA